MKKRIIIYVISAIMTIGIIGTALYFYQANIDSKLQQDKSIPVASKQITYDGKEGVTALALLKQKAKIVTSGTGEGAFVTSINGLAAKEKNQYWAFNVNGEPAVVGAGSYVTKNSDVITWKLSSF